MFKMWLRHVDNVLTIGDADNQELEELVYYESNSGEKQIKFHE